MRLHRFQLDPVAVALVRVKIIVQLLPFDEEGKMSPWKQSIFVIIVIMLLFRGIYSKLKWRSCKREIKFNYWKYLDNEMKISWNRWERCVSRAMCVKFRSRSPLEGNNSTDISLRTRRRERKEMRKKSRDERNVGKEESNKRNQGNTEKLKKRALGSP